MDPLSNDPTGDEVPIGIRGEASQLRSGPADAAAIAVGHPGQGDLETCAYSSSGSTMRTRGCALCEGKDYPKQLQRYLLCFEVLNIAIVLRIFVFVLKISVLLKMILLSPN